MRRLTFLLLAVAVLAAGCSTLNFIKRRLPPPTQGPEGMTFRFFSPSARMVQLAGNWPENNWLAGQAQTGSFNVGVMEESPPAAASGCAPRSSSPGATSTSSWWTA